MQKICATRIQIASPFDAILDRTLRNAAGQSPTATNSSASGTIGAVVSSEFSVSQEPVKDKPPWAVAALRNARYSLRLRIYQQTCGA